MNKIFASFLTEYPSLIVVTGGISVLIPALELVAIPFLFGRLSDHLRTPDAILSIQSIVVAVLLLQLAHIARGVCMTKIVTSFDLYVKSHMLESIILP